MEILETMLSSLGYRNVEIDEKQRCIYIYALGNKFLLLYSKLIDYVV